MCPTTMPHVLVAFEVGGYKITQESVCMVTEMILSPQEASANLKVEFVESAAEMKHEPMRESWLGFKPMRTQALIDGKDVGSIAWVILPHLAERLGAPCMNIWGLGVREQYRRQEGYRHSSRLTRNGEELHVQRKICFGGHTALERTCASNVCQTRL